MSSEPIVPLPVFRPDRRGGFMKTAIAAVMALGMVSAASAEPGSYTNLGEILDTSPIYAVGDNITTINGMAANEIKWFKFTWGGTSGATFFLDIDTTSVRHADVTSTTVDTELGVYDASGNLVASDDDDGAGLYSALSFGATTPTRAYTIGGDISPMTPANGRDGTLGAGNYWLAAGAYNTTFGATDWQVTSSAGGDPDSFDLNFRTDLVPEPHTFAVLGLGAAVLLRRRRK